MPSAAHSISSYLALRLLAGFILLLALASVVIFFISKGILESDFDARLFAKAQAVVASTTQKGSAIEVDWNSLPHLTGKTASPPEFVEILDAGGRHVDGTSFLTSAPPLITSGATYLNGESVQKQRVRVVVLSFLPAVEEEDIKVTPVALRSNCTVIVGDDRAELDHSLNLMAAVLATTTLFTSFFSVGVVILALARGLRPLKKLSQDVAAIDESSLQRRIYLQSLPVEVLPIAEKLNGLLARLEVSFARERRFNADVSHELRTPVAELKTLSEVMLRQAVIPPDARRAFSDALAIANHMEALVEVLTEIVRQEGGNTHVKLADVDLEATLEKTRIRFEEQAHQRNITISDTPVMHGFCFASDVRLLTIILSNLLDNGIEYSPVGSTIKLTFATTDTSGCLTISNPTTELSPSDLPHLFERFWRKDKARGESRHFGIGLALTKALCQRLDIRLSASLGASVISIRLDLPNGRTE